MIPAALAIGAGIGYLLGWCIVPQLLSGYRPFTTVREVAEDRVFGIHPDRRTRRWKRPSS